MKSVLFLFIIFLLSLFISCKKKPPENKLVGKWKIESAYVNGVDKTADLDTLEILYYEFVKMENMYHDEVFAYGILLDFNKTHWDDSCSRFGYSPFEINNDKDEISFRSVFAVPDSASTCFFNSSFIPAFVTVNYFFTGSYYFEKWRIKKWGTIEFWVEMNYNGNIYETHFKEI